MNETFLNVSNVNSNQFGLLFTRPVDDQIYAQPLIMTNVNLGASGVHNIVIVATANDSVYTFDADNASVATPYWQVSFLGPNIVPPSKYDFAYADAGFCPFFTGSAGHAGIIGTPVIDPVSETLYVVARTKELSATANFVQRLHALDLTSGAERPNSPVVIAATYPGTNSYDATNGAISFNSFAQNQRSGLTLANNIVYISWASQCDFFKFHGWVVGYDATTLGQVTEYNDTPNGSEGGIWMSGSAPAADEEGNLYLSTGNGTVGDSTSPTNIVNRGESFLKLTPAGTNLNVTSWFTPYNWVTLNSADTDLGSGGVLLIPGTDLAFSGGKQGVAYLVNRDNMGGLSLTNADTNVLQSFTVAPVGVYGGPVWWDGPNGSYVYLWPAHSPLQQYKFDWTNAMFQLPAYSKGTAYALYPPGGMMSLSANGTNAGTGILWASSASGVDPSLTIVPGYLYAFDAENVSNLLWTSLQDAPRDAVGSFAKFVPPTVANGKVYLATFSNRLDVYGLRPPSLTAALAGGNVVLSWPTNNNPNYVLQISSDLLSGNWSNILNGVVVTNGVFQVSVPASGTMSFFRLKL